MADDQDSKRDGLDEQAKELLDSLDERKFELPEPPSTDALNQRIKDVTGKSLDATVESRKREQRKTESETKDTQAYYRSTSMGLSIAYGLLAIPCVFMAAAWALRKYADLGDPWYGLVILAGVILGFVVTVKRLAESNK